MTKKAACASIQFVRARIVPARAPCPCRRHRSRGCPWLLRQHREREGVAGRGEPDRLVAARENDLALWPVVLEHVHAAVVPDRLGVSSCGGGGASAVLSRCSRRARARGRGRRGRQSAHSSLLEKTSAASAERQQHPGSERGEEHGRAPASRSARARPCRRTAHPGRAGRG